MSPDNQNSTSSTLPRCLRRWGEENRPLLLPCELGAADVRGGIVACSITHRLPRRDHDRRLVVASKGQEGEGEDSWAVVLAAVVGIAAAAAVDRPDWKEKSRPKTQLS